MTRFSGPLKVKKPFSETTVASIDVSGSAKFAQGISFGGTMTSFGTIQLGSSAADVGDVVLVKRVALPAGATKATTRLPDGSDVVDITMNVQTPLAATAASSPDVLVGVSAHDVRFARFTNATAQGFYRVSTQQTSGWSSVSGASALITVHTTAISGAIASGATGGVYIHYIKRQ